MVHDELAGIDAELEVLCARRRAALARLGQVRADLWPLDARHHRRRRGRVDEVAMPPAAPGAEPLGGVELRATCLGILRRQGACGLRELHGLVHRHGYRIDGPRAVQALADAMAYEVRQGRAVRITRGVYAAVAAGPQTLADEPLPWTDPDEDHPQLDPAVLDDPERWSDGAWPDPGDRPGSQVRPPDRYEASTLDEDVRLARARAAELPDIRSTPQDADGAEPAAAASASDQDAEHRRDPHWERFVDESFPTVRTWVERRRVQEAQAAERARRRAEGQGSRHLWGDDPDDEGG